MTSLNIRPGLDHVGLIIAPPCAGKSTLCMQYGWCDGDHLAKGLETVSHPSFAYHIYERCSALTAGVIVTAVDIAEARATGIAEANWVIYLPDPAMHRVFASARDCDYTLIAAQRRALFASAHTRRPFIPLATTKHQLLVQVGRIGLSIKRHPGVQP
jgi:hypothetical protein